MSLNGVLEVMHVLGPLKLSGQVVPLVRVILVIVEFLFTIAAKDVTEAARPEGDVLVLGLAGFVDFQRFVRGKKTQCKVRAVPVV